MSKKFSAIFLGLLFVTISLCLITEFMIPTPIQQEKSGENSKLVMRYYENVLEKMNADEIGSIFSEDFQRKWPEPSKELGPELVIEEIKLLRNKFSQFDVDVEYLVEDGEWVMSAWYGIGKPTSKQVDNPFTTNHVRYRGSSLFRIRNRQICESWNMAVQLPPNQSIYDL
ncbi:ester cyclase [bacterium]|nr:ester cyclase [bacterium]